MEAADAERLVLTYLGHNKFIDNTELFQTQNAISREALEPVLKSLEAEEYIKLTVIEKKVIELTEEGLGYAKEGSPEFQFVQAMKMGE
jgi:DNA-binding PadR family transcriptional regulator